MSDDVKNNVANVGCAIVVPTYDRPNYLRRILSYYDQYTRGSNVIVADSSSTDNEEINRKSVASMSNINIRYVSYPPEINALAKIADVLGYVDAKYCVLCADDDFITPNGISQSADFLDGNPDFTVAHGRYVSFRLEKSRGGKERFRWRPANYSHESIIFSSAAERLRFHLSNYYTPTFYAVQRTNVLAPAWREAAAFTSDYRFGELLPSVLALVYGKMKCLDVLYGARQAIPDSAGRTSKAVPDFIRDGTYNEKYAKFVDCVSKHLRRQSQLNVDESKTLIDDAMGAYMKRYHGYKYKAEHILEHVPRPIDKGIRALYRKLSLPKQNADFPISWINDDLDKIRLCVLSYGDTNETIGGPAKRGKGTA